MGLFSRLKRVMDAKANRAVEHLEKDDPVGIYKADLQKAREQLPQFESAVRDLGTEKISLGKEVEETTAEAAKWNQQAEQQMEQGNEDRALQCATRATEFEQTLESLKTRFSAATKRWDAARKKLTDHRNMIQQKEQQITTLEARQKSAKANTAMREAMNSAEANIGAIGVGGIEDQVQRLESSLEAQEQLDDEAAGDDLEQQLAASETDTAVADKMAALKAKMAKNADAAPAS